MIDNIKTAFDYITAEEKLKSDTTLYLQKRMQNQKRINIKKYAVATVLFMGIFTYIMYFTPITYVDIDINPSILLTLNRFDRIINAYAYNEYENNIVENISIKHKTYNDALVTLVEIIDREGYLQENSLISVTLQTNNKNKENILLADTESRIKTHVSKNHHNAQISVFPVSAEIRNRSFEQRVSPAKYIAISELMEIDPTASLENCRNHSISQIKEMINTHKKHCNNSHKHH